MKTQTLKRLVSSVLVLLFLFALLCPWFAWWAMGAALALFLFSLGKEMHIDAEKAFEKYRIK